MLSLSALEDFFEFERSFSWANVRLPPPALTDEFSMFYYSADVRDDSPFLSVWLWVYGILGWNYGKFDSFLVICWIVSAIFAVMCYFSSGYNTLDPILSRLASH